MTPSLDEQEENDDSRRREAQARQKLGVDDYPPCYPPGLDIHLMQNLPEECRAIVGYWQSFPGAADVSLCAQLMKSAHTSSGRGSDSKTSKARFASASEGMASTPMSTGQWSSSDRALRGGGSSFRTTGFHASLRRSIPDGLEDELSESHTPNGTDDSAEQKIERHMILLHWIEQKRQAMLDGNVTANGRNDNAVKNWWNDGQNRRKRNPGREDQRSQHQMHPSRAAYRYSSLPQGPSHHIPSYLQSRRPSLNPPMHSPVTIKLPQPSSYEPYPGSRGPTVPI